MGSYGHKCLFNYKPNSKLLKGGNSEINKITVKINKIKKIKIQMNIVMILMID